MRSSCTINYNSKPFDYKISSNAYHRLFQNRDMKHFSVNIENVTYVFTLKTSPDSSMNYIVKTIKDGKVSHAADSFSLDDVSETYDFEKDGFSNNRNKLKSTIPQSEKRELLRRLFLGKSIMIDDLNISFLHLAADVIGIPELRQIRDLTNSACTKQSNQYIFYYKKNTFTIKDSLKSFFFHLWTNVFNFFCFFGFFGRVLQSFWDLAGPTMILCFFLNLLILFITMALVTLKDYLVFFFIIVIPLLFYSLYFPNIVSISIIEAIERNLYLKKTFFYSHQRLISMLIKILFNLESNQDYIHVGRLHSFIHGVLFLTFILGFFANFMNEKASRFLNVWIIIFVFYVPLIRYLSLYFIYLVHSFVSLFNRPRRKFLEIGNFNDPFLCSFYLNERNWIDFFLAKGKKAKFAHHGRLFIRLIFSKTTFSILLTLAVIIYMICAETRMSAGQVCITIFVGVCTIFVLSTRISFPFFWIRRLRERSLTDGKLEEMLENIETVVIKRLFRYKLVQDVNEDAANEMVSEGEDESLSEDDEDEDEDEQIQSKIDNVEDRVKQLVLRQEVLKWHKQATTWSKRYKWLRWCSLVLVFFTFLFVIVLVILGGITAIETSSEPTSYQESKSQQTLRYTNYTEPLYEDFNLLDFSDKKRFPLSPICYLQPKGLTITEIIALTMLTDSPIPLYFSESEWRIFNDFLSNRGYLGSDIIFVNTSFRWDNSFLSSMTLTRFRKEPKLSVFAIRGTANYQDLIADVEIWFASVVIKIMNAFFPFVDLYSDRTIELIGVVTNMPRYAFKQFSLVEEYKNRFVDYIYDYIYGDNTTPGKDNSELNKSDNFLRRWFMKDKKKPKKLDFHIDPDEDVMIIGHSLGGGLAKIISLVTGIQAVAISGPGVRFIGHFYQNSTVKNVKETIVDIVPDQDLIARVDMQIGTQIQVPCKRGLNCHDTNRLICQVAVMCNTYQQHAEYCESLFDQETIDEMFRIGEVVT